MEERVTQTESNPLDAVIVEALRRHGPADPLGLLQIVGGRPADIVDRVCSLVVARTVQVDDQGRFVIPAGSLR